MPPPSPLRIAHIYGPSSKRPEANGIWRVLRDLADAQEQSGHEVAILSPSLRGQVTPWKTDTLAAGYCGSARSLARWADQHADVVHLHGAFIAEHTLFARHLRATPYIITPHSSYMRYPLTHRHRLIKRIWTRTLDRTLLDRAGMLHALTEREARDAALVCPRPTVVVPNGLGGVTPISEEERLRARDAHGLTTDDRLVVLIARLDRLHKGIDILEDAFARARQDSPWLRLIIAGPPEPRTPMPTPGPGVTHMGPVSGEAKRSLLAAADIFAHTSRWEGLPMAGLEAAMAGLPLLATPEAGLDEVIAVSGGAIACPGDLPAAMRSVLDSSRQGPDIARARAVSEAFSPERQVRGLDVAYRDLIARAR